MRSRPSLIPYGLFALLGAVCAASGCHSGSSQQARPAPIVSRQPVNFASRTFDPANPPSDMPPLTSGEDAECDSDFQSNATVGGETKQTDATHGIVTITKIDVTLGLNITVWVPMGVSQHVIEHEDGHRQISEYYYQTADKLAARIAAEHMGDPISIVGSDLNAEANKALQQVSMEITDEYGKELNPEPTQLQYDAITDHGRNDIAAKDAVAHTLKDVAVATNGF